MFTLFLDQSININLSINGSVQNWSTSRYLNRAASLRRGRKYLFSSSRTIPTSLSMHFVHGSWTLFLILAPVYCYSNINQPVMELQTKKGQDTLGQRWNRLSAKIIENKAKKQAELLAQTNTITSIQMRSRLETLHQSNLPQSVNPTIITIRWTKSTILL